MARKAWYAGTPLEDQINEFRSWLRESSHVSPTSIDIYVSHVGSLIKMGAKDVDDARVIDPHPTSARVTAWMKWKEWQLTKRNRRAGPTQRQIDVYNAWETQIMKTDLPPELPYADLGYFRRLAYELLRYDDVVVGDPTTMRDCLAVFSERERLDFQHVWGCLISWVRFLGGHGETPWWMWPDLRDQPRKVEAKMYHVLAHHIPLRNKEAHSWKFADLKLSPSGEFYWLCPEYLHGEPVRWKVSEDPYERVVAFPREWVDAWRRYINPRNDDFPLWPEWKGSAYPGSNDTKTPGIHNDLMRNRDGFIPERWPDGRPDMTSMLPRPTDMRDVAPRRPMTTSEERRRERTENLARLMSPSTELPQSPRVVEFYDDDAEY